MSHDTPHSSDSNETGYVIVIGRQYASGGRRIGKFIADSLGIPFYDKILLDKAAEHIGFSAGMFLKADEKRPSILRSLLQLNYGSQSSGFQDSGVSSEALYRYQSEVIRHICEQGPCVIVGRTADYVMRNHPRMLSIFVHAPIQSRVKTIINRKETNSEERAAEMARKIDRDREAYYNYYTNRNWGRADNYHLSIDSSRISDQQILSFVKDFISKSAFESK